MKRTYWLLFFCVIASLIFASCSILENGERSVTSVIESPTNTYIITPLNATKPASVTPLHTNTSLPTPENLALTPTLPPSEHGQYILDLIESTEGCQLPCIFGITPGKTTYAQVRKLFHPVQPLEAIPVKGIAGRIDLGLYMSETSYQNIYIQMEEKNNIIEVVIVNVRKFLQNDPFYIKEFAEAMEKFSLENVLLKEGIPTRVYLRLQEPAEPGTWDLIDLFVFYDNKGFFFEYNFSKGSNRDKQTGYLNVCLKYEKLELIRYYSQSPENQSVLEGLEQTIEKNLNKWYLPLGKLTELSLEDFHRIIVEKENDGCFVSP